MQPETNSGLVVRVGVDITSVADVDESLAHFGDRYARRIFTEHELASSGGEHGGRARDRDRARTTRSTRTNGCDGVSAESLAARFAAKEAAVKVLEPSGARPAWRTVEVRRAASGACSLELHGGAASLAAEQGVERMAVSLSHEAGLAVAVVVATIGPSRARPAPDVVGRAGHETIESMGQRTGDRG